MSKAAPIKQRSGRPLLDIPGAAEYLGVTERYVRRLTAERRLPFIKTGSGRTSPVRFDPDKLDEWIEAHSVPVDV